MTVPYDPLRRDFLPRMVKLPLQEKIALANKKDMAVEDLLRLNGCHFTEEDIAWLNTPKASYSVLPCSHLGTLSVLKIRN